MTKTATVLASILILAGACGQAQKVEPNPETQTSAQPQARIQKPEAEQRKAEGQVEQDPLKVKAEAGDANSQYLMGRRHSWDDWTEAMRWYRMAAYQGHPDAQYFLGEAYCNWRSLQGVPHDVIECYAWTHISCAGTLDRDDYADCREMLHATAETMTSAQIREGLARAAELQAEIANTNDIEPRPSDQPK